MTEELGKVGLRLHYHGVLVCSARVGQQLLEDSWRWGWSVISQARSFGDVVAYVAKYTVKDVVQEVGSGLPSWFDIRGEAKGHAISILQGTGCGRWRDWESGRGARRGRGGLLSVATRCGGG